MQDMTVAELIQRAEPGTGSGDTRPVQIIVARRRPQRRTTTLGRLAQWVLLIALTTVMVVAGVELRRWYFAASAPIRFTGDIHNAFAQGSHVYNAALAAAREAGRDTPTLLEVLAAYRDRYDIVANAAERRNPTDPRYGLDYPPARLLTMTLWVRHVQGERPGAARWVDDDLWPLLTFNTVIAGIGAAGVFLLVRFWGIRAWHRRRQDSASQDSAAWAGSAEVAHPDQPWDHAPRARAWDALWAPFIAAMLFWFNPAILSNAHTWPQWDVWLLPGYIWAAYFASRGWWFSGGVAIALACVFKGQILIVAPVLLLWAMFQGRLGAMLRAGIGFACAMALMMAIWLYGGRAHGQWLLGTALAAMAVLTFIAWRNRQARRSRRCTGVVNDAPDAPDAPAGHGASLPPALASDGARQADGSALAAGVESPVGKMRWFARHRQRLLASGAALLAMTVAALLVWPWQARASDWRGIGYLGLLAALALPLVYPRNFRWGVWVAAILAGVLLLGPVLYEGSYAWARVGYLGPTDNHRAMHMGATYNLAAILSDVYGWHLNDPVEWAGDMSMQSLTRWVYLALLVATAAGLALHAAWGSRGVLVALVTPWLIMFAVLAQMHERYLTYAAAVSAILVGYRWGFVLLHGVITLLATALLHTPEPNRRLWPEMYNIIRGSLPGASWALLLVAAVFFWVSVTPRRRAIE